MTSPEQVRAWWERHGLDKLSDISAVNVLAAREADWAEALRIDRVRIQQRLARDAEPPTPGAFLRPEEI